MTMPSIHASAVLVGARAVLIQGPSGSGKSRLALALLHAAERRALMPFARLVADDRAHVEAAHGRLLVRPAAGARRPDRGARARHPPRSLRAAWPWSDSWSNSARKTPNVCLLAAEHRPSSRESRCRGLPSQRVPTPYPVWPICNRPTRGSFRQCGRRAIARESPIYAGIRRAAETPGRAVYCNAATHYISAAEPLNSGFG